MLRPTTGRDAWGRVTTEWAEEEMAGALWYEPVTSTAEADDADLSAGDASTLGLHVPKAYAAPLAGCRVRLPDGTEWDVVGDPRGHMAENTPGPWNRLASCVRHTAAG